MAELAVAMAVVGTLVGVAGNVQAGQNAYSASQATAAGQEAEGQYRGAAADARKVESDFEAQQMDAKAISERATSHRAAAEERRQMRLAQSKLLARAAAGGGGALDPTVVNLDAQLEGEGEYRALTQLFQGEERARDLESGAALKRYEGAQYGVAGNYARASGKRTATLTRQGGSQARDSYNMKAVGTLVGGGGSLAGKYGGKTQEATYEDFIG